MLPLINKMTPQNSGFQIISFVFFLLLAHFHAQATNTVPIDNAGFESDWSGWSDTDPSSISGSFYTGVKSAKITGEGGKFDQIVNVSTDTEYTLTAYVLGMGIVGATVGGTDYNQGGDFGDWTKVSVTFNSGSNTSITLYGAYNGGDGRFDDFSLSTDAEEPEEPQENPAHILDLTKWKVTYPLDDNGDDSSEATHYDNRNNNAHEMQGSEIDGAIPEPYDEYFYVSGDEVRFKGHVGGATSQNSGYPRSELRQLVGGSSNYWNMSEFQYLDVRVRATNLPNIKPEVSMVQIHGPVDEPLRVEYREDSQGLHVTQNETITVPDVLPYALGEQLRVTVLVDLGEITCTIINESRPELDPWTDTWTAVDLTGYFKVGCYTQSSSVLNTFKDPEDFPINPAPSEYGEVAVKDLTLIETYQNTDPHNITAATLTNQVGTTLIDVVNHTVSMEVPFGTDMTSLAPTIAVSASASISPASDVAQDFSEPVVYTVTAGDDMTSQDWTITITDAITWNGTAWSNTYGPSTFENARIQDDYAFSTSGVFGVKNLTVDASATLVVDEDATLTVEEDLVVSGALNIESGASLITYDANSLTGNDITFKRMTRYSDGRYSMVGSPMKQNSTLTGSDLGSFVYQYDEVIPYTTDGLARWISANTEELIPGRGYTQANAQELVFVGKPNEGTISYTGTYTQDTDDANEGWNLLSNPYTAAISVSAFLEHNDNLEGAIYLWDDNGSGSQRGTSADYVVANGLAATNTTPAGGETRYNKYVGSAQGFFAQLVDGESKTIEFTESMRSQAYNKDDNFFRKVETPIVRLNLTDEKGLFRQTVLAWKEDASATEVIKAYDARLFDSKASSAIYTFKQDQKLAIQALPQNWNEVALGMTIDQTGTYTLSCEGEQSIFLKDLETGAVIDLKQNTYSFTVTQGDLLTDRFVLSPNNQFEVLDLPAIQTKIYASGHTLYFNQLENSLSKQYRLINLSGQTVLEFTVNTSTSIDLSILKRGLYIVTDGQQGTKVFLDK